ncbi:hypothetical protein GCM10020255_047330 [Rhodococcus baikonurensis]
MIIGNPGPAHMFDDRIYKRGALTLHALRGVLGDEKFFELIRQWTTKHRHSTVSTEQFTDLASRFTDTPLRPLWDAWLNQRLLPRM